MCKERHWVSSRKTQWSSQVKLLSASNNQPITQEGIPQLIIWEEDPTRGESKGKPWRKWWRRRQRWRRRRWRRRWKPSSCSSTTSGSNTGHKASSGKCPNIQWRQKQITSLWETVQTLPNDKCQPPTAECPNVKGLPCSQIHSRR